MTQDELNDLNIYRNQIDVLSTYCIPSPNNSRSLLVGVNKFMHTFHVYLYDETAFTYQFYSKNGQQNEVVFKRFSIRDILDVKFLYPELCDYDFCWFLVDAGVHLTFTGFGSSGKKPGDFPGPYFEAIRRPEVRVTASPT